MAKKDEKLNNNSGKLEGREPNGRLKKGVKLPGAGRPLGSLNYITLLREAMKRIKDKDTGKSITEVDIVFTQLQKGLNHDSKQLTDVIERLFGKVPDRVIDETPKEASQSREEVERLTNEFLNNYQIVTKKK